MKINDDHMYHGAALTQIAEHPVFKAVNAFWSSGKKSSCAFRINDTTGIYIKYAGAPRGSANEYVFTFTQTQLDEFTKLREHCTSVFAVFVCIGAKAICSLSYGQVMNLIKLRRNAKGGPEEQYQIMVTAHANKQFRAYVNKPSRKGLMMGETLVARNAFPEILFEDQLPV
jgi:hypothetical protein